MLRMLRRLGSRLLRVYGTDEGICDVYEHLFLKVCLGGLEFCFGYRHEVLNTSELHWDGAAFNIHRSNSTRKQNWRFNSENKLSAFCISEHGVGFNRIGL